MIYRDCVCIAQARVIEGKRKKAHICTIAYHQPSNQFLRVCLPFNKQHETGVRRWMRFSFEGDKASTDTRQESVAFGALQSVGKRLSLVERQDMHQRILSHYKYEDELNQQRYSIGILLPVAGSLSFDLQNLDERESEYRNLMAAKGLFFPDFKIYVSGKRTKDHNPFRKQLLQWDVIEAIRKGIDPFGAISAFKDPYIVMGNTPWVRNAFMAVSILSAPPKAKLSAHNQQLTLINA